MTASPGHNSQGERGMILVIVLWTVSIMTVIAVALTTYVQRNLRTASTDNLQLRTELVLRSGVQVAGALILGVKEDQRLFLASDVRTVDLGDGRTAEITINDATNRVDLNKTAPEFLQAVMIAALESKGEGKAITEAILELRKKAETKPADKAAAKSSTGERKSVGEASTQQQPSLANPDNADEKAKVADFVPMFVSPMQLLSLPGIEPAQVQKAIPYVTVASKEGKINPMTATDAVLRAIPKIKDADVDVIRQARSRKDVKSEAFKAVMDTYGGVLTIDPPTVYRVSVILKSGVGVIAGSRQFATILLTPEAPKPFQVLSFSW